MLQQFKFGAWQIVKPHVLVPILALLVGVTSSMAVPTLAQDKLQSASSYGFVLTEMAPAFHKDRDELQCPDGLAMDLMQSFLATQTPAEVIRLLKPENAVELEKKYKDDFVYGPNGTNICSDPTLFRRPLQRTVGSNLAFGMNLDGDEGGRTPGSEICPHENFQGLDGARGVDNQYFRAVGCNRFWRGTTTLGITLLTSKAAFALDVNTAVIMIQGVDDLRDDDDVEFVIASSPDFSPKNNRQQVLSGGSFTLTPNPHWRNVAKARIQNGVLTTEPVDVYLHYVKSAASGDMVLKRARFRLELLPNGELKGLAGAYWPIDNIWRGLRTGTGAATTAGLDCAAAHATLLALADGDRDPKTGKCSAASIALDVTAVPAFIFDDGRAVAGPLVLTR